MPGNDLKNLKQCIDTGRRNWDEVCRELPCTFQSTLPNGRDVGIELEFTDGYTESGDEEDCVYQFVVTLEGGIPVQTNRSQDLDESDFDPKRFRSFTPLACSERFVEATFNPHDLSVKLTYFKDDLFSKPARTTEETLLFGAWNLLHVNGQDITSEIEWERYTTKGTETLKSLAEKTGIEFYTFTHLLYAANPGIDLPIKARKVSSWLEDEQFTILWEKGVSFYLPRRGENYSGEVETEAPLFCRTSYANAVRPSTTCHYKEE